MDGTNLAVFLFSTFVGDLVAGLAGFAKSLVVSGIWLHILTPIQTVTLIVGYGLLVQGYGVWELRHALSLRKVMPFIFGGALGVPIGAALLAFINPGICAWLSVCFLCFTAPRSSGGRRSNRRAWCGVPSGWTCAYLTPGAGNPISDFDVYWPRYVGTRLRPSQGRP